VTASAYGLATPHGPAWLKDALCARPEYADERDLWFAQKKDKAAVRRARQICWLCPVLAACGQSAYETREPFGTWGAVSESERRAMLRRRGIRLPYEDDDETGAAT